MVNYELTEEGRDYLENGLPENNLVKILRERGKIPLSQAQREISNFNVALMWAKKNEWVFIENGFIRATRDPSSYLEDSLESVSRGIEDEYTETLLKRNLIREVRETMSDKAAKLKGKDIGILTTELIKTGAWKDVNLKPYSVDIVGKKIYPGKKHPLTVYKNKIRKIFLDMGFTEAHGNFIESSLWNFDSLYIPQDHPAREMQDTFYMKTPSKSKIDKKLAVKIKKMHEEGDDLSSGWGYKWSEENATRPVLRTHTTPVSIRHLLTGKPPIKMFCIGRVFRNETVDFKHLAEFTQIEGIVADENANFSNLLGYLKEFYKRMGFDKIRFRPAYFPYTEMSVEVDVWMDDRKEWLELGGAGLFREEVTKPLGIDVPVLAWGQGLERLVFLRMRLNDIRNFYYKNDLELLRGASIWQ